MGWGLPADPPGGLRPLCGCSARFTQISMFLPRNSIYPPLRSKGIPVSSALCLGHIVSTHNTPGFRQNGEGTDVTTLRIPAELSSHGPEAD